MSVQFIAEGPGHLTGECTVFIGHNGKIHVGCIVHRVPPHMKRGELLRSLFDGPHLADMFVTVNTTERRLFDNTHHTMIPRGVTITAVPL